MNLLNMLRHDRHSSNQARKARLRRQPALDSLEERKVLSTFTVTSVADSGLGTLRQAIVGADAASDAATINFAITSASKTISLRSALPELSNTHGMTINGQSGVEVDLTHASLADGNSIHVDQLASVTVNNLEFDNAPARAFENNGTLVLSDVTVSGSHNGAAVNYGTMTISNSTIKNNVAANFGGGVDNYSGTLSVVNSTFTGNSTTYGGAIDNNASLSVSGSTFQSNNASGGGGALWDTGSAQTLIDSSTISYNSSQSSGGGIAVDGKFDPKLTNDNVYGNTAKFAPDIYGVVDKTSSNNVIGYGTGMTGIVDNNPFARTDGLKHATYNKAKPTNFIGTPGGQARPVMWQEVNLDGAVVDYYYTTRTNSSTMTITGTGTQRLSLGSSDGDNGEGPTVYPNHFAVDLFLTDAENGESGSISLWQNYDAASLSAPSLTITNGTKTKVTDNIEDLTHTWVDLASGTTTVNTWTNGFDNQS
jgi:predicted outer membrane repeat protein